MYLNIGMYITLISSPLYPHNARTTELFCVGVQVKDGSHVVIWTACKGTHNQYETGCGIRRHPQEGINANGNIPTLVTITKFIL